jgi:MATE family multidrug resistance protein
MMPPADADLRSQEEILSQGGESSDVGDEYIDDGPTPRPMKPRTGWLSPDEQTPRPQTNRTSYIHQTAATETSPLLASTDSDPHQHYSSSRGSSWSRTGGTSGWDILQPGPPGQGELDEIAGEAATDNLYTREIRVLLTYLIPTWGTHILELSLNIVSVFSLGHLGVNELAASSLSSMTANVTGYSVIAGFVSALDSLLPGAYTSQPKQVGLITQRMAVIVAMMLPGIVAIWLVSEQILLLLGQEPIVAKLAGLYLQILAIGLPAYAGFEICRRYLQAQGLFHAPTVVLLFVSPLNAFLNWLLVWGPDSVRLGFIGAPIASVIS